MLLVCAADKKVLSLILCCPYSLAVVRVEKYTAALLASKEILPSLYDFMTYVYSPHHFLPYIRQQLGIELQLDSRLPKESLICLPDPCTERHNCPELSVYCHAAAT